MKKILIVKIGAIGDVVMALPMLQYLKNSNEKTHITWICGNTVAPLLQKLGLVDNIIIVNEQKIFQGSFYVRLKELLFVYRKIAFRFFEKIIIGHIDFRYRIFTLFSRATKKSSFYRNKNGSFPVLGRYHTEEYLRLAQNNTGSSFSQYSYPSIVFSSSLEKKMHGKQPVITIAPGGAKNILADDPQRQWPMDHYVALTKMLLEKGYKVIITGSKNEEWIASYFADLDIENCIGKTTLLELIEIIKDSDLLITHDCGPMHLAKLTKTPTIALFGPTNPKEKVGNEEIIVLWGGEHFSCSPCYDGKCYAQCSSYRCMQSIAVQQVIEQIDNGLKNMQKSRAVTS